MRGRLYWTRWLIGILTTLSIVVVAMAQGSGHLRLVSINQAGTSSANDSSFGARLSADGNTVVWTSGANNLVSGDTNLALDVFVRDLNTGSTHLVSSNAGGTASGNGESIGPAVSADGRYIAFVSEASDLVPNDRNDTRDVFVRDRLTGTTTLISANESGTGSGNGASFYALLSADGQTIAFSSAASDLVSNDTNGWLDVFAHNLQTHTTQLVTVNSEGTASANDDTILPAVSANGQIVSFESIASDLVANDNNYLPDIFVRDLKRGTTILVSVNSAGTGSANQSSSNARLNTDGNFVVFSSFATDLVPVDTNSFPDIFIRDLTAGTTTLASINLAGTDSGDSFSFGGTVSADGRLIAFESFSSDLVESTDTNNATDVFVRDRIAGRTTLVSANRAGTSGGNDASFGPIFSGDGRFVAFRSVASDLVPNDTQPVQDIYLHHLATSQTMLISNDLAGTNGGNDKSDGPVLSVDGQYVVFHSAASDLVSNDYNRTDDIFSVTRMVHSTPPTSTSTATSTPSSTPGMATASSTPSTTTTNTSTPIQTTTPSAVPSITATATIPAPQAVYLPIIVR